MCFVCVWCVYYVFYVYMGQVPEIKLMMIFVKTGQTVAEI